MAQIGYFDTNVLIDFFNGHEPAKAAMERFTDLRLPAVTYIEFMAGLKNQRQIELADQAIKNIFDIIHTNDEICAEAATLRRGSRVKLPDQMIYATARVGGGVLVTLNTKDFDPRLEDVWVPYGG